MIHFKRKETFRCDKCESMFVTGNSNGMPNGMTFVMKDDKQVTLCQKCIIKLGKLNEEEKQEFFKELGVETKGETE